MNIVSVWDKNHTGVREKCLINSNGDYVGVETSNIYLKKNGYYHSKQYIAIIKGCDENNNTGMIHLDDPSENDYKNNKLNNLIGCYVTLESAHNYGDIKVYRCLEISEYVTEKEVIILSKQIIRKWKIDNVLDLDI